MRRLSLSIPLIYALLLICASCTDKFHTDSGAVWGTSYRIVYYAPHPLTDSIMSVMKEVEDNLSMFRPSSTVSRINLGEDIPVGAMFDDVFRLSKRISALSSGSFDPTVAPLTDLWGFGLGRTDSLPLPSPEAIDSVLAGVGIGDCSICHGHIRRKSPATRFDFSSVAKGYGVDAIAAMLRRNVCSDYLVEIGGELTAAGLNPRRQPWRVQIDAPSSGVAGHNALTLITLSDAALATSGNYRNYRDTPSGRIGHTIDPRTGLPAVSPTISATVMAPDCATADALATACMVLSPDEAVAMIEALPGIEALLVTAPADSLILTSGFPL